VTLATRVALNPMVEGAIDMKSAMYGERGGQHPLARWIDHGETYGPQVIEEFVRSLSGLRAVVDLGAGSGRDLAVVKRRHPEATTIAIEASREYGSELRGKADQVHLLNIEQEALPFDDCSIDLIIANQVLEHTKEVFWIFHEVTRCLKIDGHVLIGVPNIASLHNRVLMSFGVHPTQHKLCSAHVRPFSKQDTEKFLDACFPRGYAMAAFRGSQFYPFPRSVSRVLSTMFPTAAFSIFFLLQKKRPYEGEFATYPEKANLETNFYTGRTGTRSRY
jgi:SAM-dependent methyltransferase